MGCIDHLHQGLHYDHVECGMKNLCMSHQYNNYGSVNEISDVATGLFFSVGQNS